MITDEAKWVLDNLEKLNLPAIGTFVEIGAYDGIQGSNTLPFEERAWTGLICEADPLNAWKCRENRKCDVLCAAIGAEIKVELFHINLDDRGLSGLERTPQNCKSIFIPTIPLAKAFEILPDNCEIDLLSIDTEGTETEVWMSIGWHRPKVVIIEHNTLGKPSNREAVVQEMTSSGYTLVFENDVNCIFSRA